jgi:hypothetical protein
VSWPGIAEIFVKLKISKTEAGGREEQSLVNAKVEGRA